MAATYTAATLKAEIRYRLFPNGDTYLDSQIDNAMDIVATDIATQIYCNGCDISSGAVGVANTSYAYTNANLLFIWSVRDEINNRRLEPASLSDVHSRPGSTTGAPHSFYTIGRNVHIFPAAGATTQTVTIRFYVAPDGKGADNFGLPVHLVDLGLVGCEAHLLRIQGKMDRALQAYQEYRQVMRNALDQYQAEFEAMGATAQLLDASTQNTNTAGS